MSRGLPAIVLALTAAPALAAPPTGAIDNLVSPPRTIRGWASDPDSTVPVRVRLQIDDKQAHTVVANGSYPGHDGRGFTWQLPATGSGSHTIKAIAVGIDAAGTADAVNTELGSKTWAGSCDELTSFAKDWCTSVATYHPLRVASSDYLYNGSLRAGFNRSFGGTMYELYGPAHNDNLLAEAFAGGVQLILNGFDPVGPTAWFVNGSSTCLATSYPNKTSCDAAKPANTTCVERPYSSGSHLASCSGGLLRCQTVDVGAPWVGVQSQGDACGIDVATNDATGTSTATEVNLGRGKLYSWTKAGAMPGVAYALKATLATGCVKLDYRISVGGTLTLSAEGHEVPRFFLAPGMNETYYYYSGADPWNLQAVSKTSAPASAFWLTLQGRQSLPGTSPAATLSESWVTVCNPDEARCLTLASFSPHVRQWLAQAKGYHSPAYPGGHVAAYGYFALAPGLDETITVYACPFRYDALVGTKTLREHLGDLAATSGCFAWGYPCDDGNDCTERDACDGAGGCHGSARPCPAQDECHDPGTCTPGAGCSNPAKPDGSPCAHGYCQAGTCVMPPDAGAPGPDASTPPDAAALADAGAEPDAGAPDASLQADAALDDAGAVDASERPDTGRRRDTGSPDSEEEAPDAEVSDSGALVADAAGLDASAPGTDAASGPGTFDLGGCGCGAGGNPAVLLGLAAAVAVLRRRR